eukprot:2868853-Pleurochrysis_carterae.AAC.1
MACLRVFGVESSGAVTKAQPVDLPCTCPCARTGRVIGSELALKMSRRALRIERGFQPEVELARRGVVCGRLVDRLQGIR